MLIIRSIYLCYLLFISTICFSMHLMLKMLKLIFTRLWQNFENVYVLWSSIICHGWCWYINAWMWDLQWMPAITENNKIGEGTPLLFRVPVVIVIKSWRYGVLDNFTQIERNTLIWLSIEFIHQHFSYLLIHVELFFSLNYYFTTCLSSAQGIRSSSFSVMVINMTFEFYNLTWESVNKKFLEISDSSIYLVF